MDFFISKKEVKKVPVLKGSKERRDGKYEDKHLKIMKRYSINVIEKIERWSLK